MISQRWIDQQETKLTCLNKDSDHFSKPKLEIEEGKAERSTQIDRLVESGLIINLYPGYCVITGQRIQGGEGYVRKNDVGNWEIYSRAGAAQAFGV